MPGETDLTTLLASLRPRLLEGEFVFCALADGRYGDYADALPLASFCEEEGLTLLLKKDSAEKAELEYDAVFRLISLSVHSSLEAVGLTAAVAGRLAERGISANMVAAYHHDHVLVPVDQADDAMQALREFDG